MTELREAWEAMGDRHEALSKESSDFGLLLMGMDVNPDEIEALALEFATEAWGSTFVELAVGRRESVDPRELLVTTSSAWTDGFTVGAMVFLRRLERATRDA